MSWERDPLWAKAGLFFERAFAEDRSDPTFGLWCSLGIELLARSAVASVSPTLLAEPDREHRNLLHAIGRGSERNPRKSIPAAQVFALCVDLFGDFTREHLTSSMALVNRRNEELHSGAAAFEQFPPSQWLAGFYGACQVLAEAIDESLTTLFGEEEAKIASEILAEDRNDTRQRAQSRVASHRSVFISKSPEEQDLARKDSKEEGERLSREGHHRVECPACASTALVSGKAFGNEHVADEDGDIVVRQPVAPTKLSCSACGLKLEGYAELEAVDLGGYYTRTTYYTPDGYYGLIHPDDLPSHLEEYLATSMLDSLVLTCFSERTESGHSLVLMI